MSRGRPKLIQADFSREELTALFLIAEHGWENREFGNFFKRGGGDEEAGNAVIKRLKEIKTIFEEQDVESKKSSKNDSKGDSNGTEERETGNLPDPS